MKKVYKTSRKYQCPCCDKKFNRMDLITHVEEEHEALIPEDYTAARLVYDSINKTDHGTCMICKKPVYEWNEKTARYNNLCGSKKCREEVRRIALERHIKTYNTPTLLTDPAHQEKMLSNRHISGSYHHSDGANITYTGSYEKAALEFMDNVMGIPSKDIQMPGPTLEYEYDGKTHSWITDIYYIPANLIIEVKDGGNNPNNRNMPEYRGKQAAKEIMITELGKFNYLRLTNNNFSQLLEALADIKYENLDQSTAPQVRFYINESTSLFNEKYLMNSDDIYYNKDKFDSGEINLCFITGHSGSGKSTMGRNMQGNKIEHYEMDDIHTNFNFSDEDLKEYGELIYSYFKGPGKRFRYHTKKECLEDTQWDNKDGFTNGYEVSNSKAFIDHAISFAKSHKNTKFVIEGVWIYLFSNPEFFKDYAVYIKGTSMLKSYFRMVKRDSKEEAGGNVLKYFLTAMDKIVGKRKAWKNYFEDEKRINNFINYYSKLQNTIKEYTLLEVKRENPKLYHISESSDWDDSTIEPRIPKNFLTDNGYEENKTPRVCFSSTIDGCLRALSANIKNKDFYVFVPDGNYDVYSPSVKEVPDCKVTNEKWIKERVTLKMIGKIHVSEAKDKGHKYTYGDNKSAELYDWNWKWIEKYNEEVGGIPPRRATATWIEPVMMDGGFDGFAIGNDSIETMFVGSLEDELESVTKDEFEKKYRTSGETLVYNGDDATELFTKLYKTKGTFHEAMNILAPGFRTFDELALRPNWYIFDKNKHSIECDLTRYGIYRESEILSGKLKFLDNNTPIKGAVLLSRSDKGFFIHTPKDYYLSSNFYDKPEDIPQNIIDTMADLYNQYKERVITNE